MGETNIINTMKPGQKILVCDGFYEETGIAYGLTKNQYGGYELRVKIFEENGNVSFRVVNSVKESKNRFRQIGAFKM